MLDADVVIVVLTSICWTQPEKLFSEAEIHNFLSPAVARVPLLFVHSNRSENREIKRSRAIDVSNSQVE